MRFQDGDCFVFDDLVVVRVFEYVVGLINVDYVAFLALDINDNGDFL